MISTDNTTITDVTSVVEGIKVSAPLPVLPPALSISPAPCQTSIALINVFFYFVASIGITLCFFILLVSFDASVRQVRRVLISPTPFSKPFPPPFFSRAFPCIASKVMRDSLVQSAWEFGVLRSLGVTRLQLTRCFVYETVRAAVLSQLLASHADLVQVASMFASIFSGTLIGLGFAVVLTYQQVARVRRVATLQLVDACMQGLFTELPFVFLFPTGLYNPPLPTRVQFHFLLLISSSPQLAATASSSS